jgi:hypothetical protein
MRPMQIHPIGCRVSLRQGFLPKLNGVTFTRFSSRYSSAVKEGEALPSVECRLILSFQLPPYFAESHLAHRLNPLTNKLSWQLALPHNSPAPAVVTLSQLAMHSQVPPVSLRACSD